ncbi:MAG: DUF2806 domain-containing protein [Crocinitomicaceae bacterium]
MFTVISKGVGKITKPYLIRKTADAKAYEIKTISEAMNEAYSELQQIEYDNNKIKISSLDESQIQDEISLNERQLNRNQFIEQKRQLNVESITQHAIEDMETEETISNEEVDDDWITRFFDYAKDVSNEEMQKIWGKILSGQVKNPKSFSFRTLDALRNLSKEEAKIFAKVAQYAILDHRDAFLYKGKKNQELLKKFNIQYSDITLLQELDLLHTGDFVGLNMKKSERTTIETYQFGSKVVVVKRKPEAPSNSLSIFLFTSVGKELLTLIKNESEFDYLLAFAKDARTAASSVQHADFLKREGNQVTFKEPLIDIPE